MSYRRRNPLSRIAMRGGTAVSTENLCRTCRSATIARGHAVSEELVKCEVFGMLRYPIAECTDYVDKDQTSLNMMRETAWVILPDKRTGDLGFVTPDIMRKLVQEGEAVEV